MPYSGYRSAWHPAVRSGSWLSGAPAPAPERMSSAVLLEAGFETGAQGIAIELAPDEDQLRAPGALTPRS